MDDSGKIGPFGNLGTAIYDDELQEWHFPREPQTPYRLVVVKDDPWGVHDPIPLPDPVAREAARVTEIVSAYPELQPSKELLQDLLHTSDAIQHAVQQYDANIGSLISLSLVYDQVQNRHMHVLAWAGGPSGGDVMVSRLLLQNQGWYDTQLAGLKVPVPAGHQAVWHGPGAPVQQVCFAQATVAERAPFFAVRLLDRTVIFRVTCDTWEILLLPLHEIEHGVALHTHVAFNYFYTRQYAVMDSSGDWEVWQLEAKFKPRQISRHSMPVRADDTFEDGWRKVTWVGGPSTVAVADRRRLLLCNVDDGEVKHDCELALSPDCWILDLLVYPSTPHHLFVLTGKDLLVLQVEEDVEGIAVRRILMLQHHLNIRDLTLRLYAFDEDEDLVVLVHSRLKNATLCYKMNVTSNRPTLTGPTSVKLPIDVDGAVVQVRGFCQSHFNPASSSYENHQQHNLATYNLLALQKDHTLQQTLFCSTAGSGAALREVQWHKRIKTGTSRFVNEEDLEDEEACQEEQPISQFVKSLQHARSTKAAPRAIDLSGIGRHVDAAVRQPLQDVRELLASAQQHIEEDRHSKTIQTLNELATAAVTTTDPESADDAIKELLSVGKSKREDVDAEAHMMLEQLPELDLPAMPPTSLSATYDSVIADWITPLSMDVPTSARLAMEGLARGVAAEVTLASHVLRIERPAEDETQQQSELPDFSASLPIRGVSTLQQRLLAQASALPTPSPSATPSVLTQASSAYAPHDWNITDVTSFAKPLPVSLARSVQRVLQHWDVGTNPDDYNWKVYSQRITEQTEAEDLESQLTEKERARLRRKADRQIKRSRREAAASQQDMSTQMPQLIVSASQPARPRMAASSPPPQTDLSSSQVMPVAASQAVSGKFGGRPVKKKRKRGF